MKDIRLKKRDPAWWRAVRFDDAGLVPAVVQERGGGRVLMVAYMNRESLALTRRTGFTHFWSRSRGQLWKKGDTSGHVQRVVSIRLDCDGDTLLIEVDQEGPACHTGSDSCFFRRAAASRWIEEHVPEGQAILARVYGVIQDRKAHPREGSYVSSLLTGGLDRILKKVGEEAGEAIIASKNGVAGRIVSETADLWFHTLVALGYHDVPPQAVFDELARRFGRPARGTAAAPPPVPATRRRRATKAPAPSRRSPRRRSA